MLENRSPLHDATLDVPNCGAFPTARHSAFRYLDATGASSNLECRTSIPADLFSPHTLDNSLARRLRLQGDRVAADTSAHSESGAIRKGLQQTTAIRLPPGCHVGNSMLSEGFSQPPADGEIRHLHLENSLAHRIPGGCQETEIRYP
jgi:hypothetical protein